MTVSPLLPQNQAFANPMGQFMPQVGDAAGRLGGIQPNSPMQQMLGMQTQMNGILMMLTTLLLELMMGLGGGAGALGGGAQGAAPSSVGGSSGGGGGGGGGGASSAAPAGAAGSVDNGPVNATGKTAEFIKDAKSHQGAPYVFGAAGPKAFDCSGLVYASLNEAGVKVPRLTADGYKNMFSKSAVSKDQLKPGDLLFYHSANTRGIPAGHATHIEVYLGNGMSMGTDNPGEGARVEKVNWASFIGGARVPQLQG